MASVQIEIDGIPLIVVGNYYSAEAATRTDPGTPEEYEVCEVMLPDSKYDIAEMMKDRFDEIEPLALIAYREQHAAAKIDRRIAA